MNRWRAFLVHLAISLVVIGGVGVTLLLVWYPPSLLGFAGGGELLALVAGIDIVVGPLLTLLVFKPGKKSLRFDLGVIALLQLGFLAYGVSVAWQTRPVFLVAAIDRIDVVFAHEVLESDLAEASRPEYAQLPWGAPVLVGANIPKDDPAAMDDALEGAGEGRDIDKRPKFYRPFDEVAQDLLARSSRPQVGLVTIDDWQAKMGDLYERRESLRSVPMYSSRGEARMLIDAETGRPVQAIW